MARSPSDDPLESRQRGIGSLPAAAQIATFLPVGPEHQNYDQFMELYGDVYDPERARRAWEETGLYSGPEFYGTPMREISDAAARFLLTNSSQMADGSTLPLYQVMEHPELYEAEPWLRNTLVTFTHGLGEGILGGYGRDSGRIYLNPRAHLREDMTGEEYVNALLSTLLHEGAGHAVQYLYGLPAGASLNRARRLAQEMGGVSEGDESTYLEGRGLDLLDVYRHAPGEAASRNIEARREMSPEARAQSYPGDTLDTDPSLLREVSSAYDLIQRLRGGF